MFEAKNDSCRLLHARALELTCMLPFSPIKLPNQVPLAVMYSEMVWNQSTSIYLMQLSWEDSDALKDYCSISWRCEWRHQWWQKLPHLTGLSQLTQDVEQ